MIDHVAPFFTNPTLEAINTISAANPTLEIAAGVTLVVIFAVTMVFMLKDLASNNNS